ncbi:ATP-binding protein [Marivirga sp.]|uniref:ATP-binding protein n=1 Tax=Marivirga sp. TaxID=2018662 RepID=UPI0025DF6D14|nr:ATP-binding protein [Marivirga sp.]
MDNIQFEGISADEAFNAPTKINFTVVPGYYTKHNKSSQYLTTLSHDKFSIIKNGSKLVDGFEVLKLGDTGTLVSEGGRIKIITKTSLVKSGYPTLGYKYYSARGLMKFTSGSKKLYEGENILIRGAHGSGKTTCATEIANGFQKNGFQLFRVLFGQRREDSLGNNTKNISSSATIHRQLDEFYYYLSDVVREAHAGKKVCLVIDSIDRFILDQYEHLPKEANKVLNLVTSIFSLSGVYTNGSITIICTKKNHPIIKSNEIVNTLNNVYDKSIDLS